MKKITIILLFSLIAGIISAQTAEEIIQKHIEKIGGIQNWDKVESIKMYGKLSNARGLTDIETFVTKGFSYGTREIEGKHEIEFGFDGTNYWKRSSDKGLKKSNKERATRAKKSNEDFKSYLINYKEKGYKIELLEDDNIQGEECYVLEINRGKKPKHGEMVDDIIIIYISKETYMIVAEELEYIRGSFDAIMYVYYSDYKDVDGLKLHFKSTIIINEQTYKILVDKYELNAKVDQSSIKFEE